MRVVHTQGAHEGRLSRLALQREHWLWWCAPIDDDAWEQVEGFVVHGAVLGEVHCMH